MSVEAGISGDLSTGLMFAGRYRVERRIAAGGMGAVYEVVHIETNRRRALKVMHAHYVSSDELRARFRQESQVAADIESEHIVDVFDAGVDEGTGMPFLVMELLRGEELGRLSKRVGPLPKEDVVRYLYETSLALDKMHRARIVHRDLKPDNLFLCEREHGSPRVKVLDLGIAKIVKDAETQANATRSLGTPLYMAPEQFLLTSGVSPATDIFALGMIAFTLLVGKPYWLPESKMAGEMLAFAMHVATGPKEPAVTRAWELFGVALPKAFDSWFFRATARESSARFPSAIEAVIALAEALGVPLRTGEFVANNVGIASSPPLADPSGGPETALAVRTGQSSPRTRPTMMAMTPALDGNALPADAGGRRSRWFVVIGMVATLLVGFGIFSVVKGSSVKQRDQSVRQASEPVISEAPNTVRVEPAVAIAPAPSAVAVPSAGAQTPEPMMLAEPIQSAKPAVKAPMTSPRLKTRPVKPKIKTDGRIWTGD